MRLRVFASALLALAPLGTASAAGLGGSRASMRKQYTIAKQHAFTFLRTAAQVREFAQDDRLETLTSTDDYVIADVSFPYARSVVRLFIERLAAQYRAATGERLVVTSLTRPTTLQPRNASRLSVHPTGMAVDLRVPATAKERAWLERMLLSLEDKGVLDVTREHRPSHYHVAVFPDSYDAYAKILSPASNPAHDAFVALPIAASLATTAVLAPAPRTLPLTPALVAAACAGLSALLVLLTVVIRRVRVRAEALR